MNDYTAWCPEWGEYSSKDGVKISADNPREAAKFALQNIFTDSEFNEDFYCFFVRDDSTKEIFTIYIQGRRSIEFYYR